LDAARKRLSRQQKLRKIEDHADQKSRNTKFSNCTITQHEIPRLQKYFKITQHKMPQLQNHATQNAAISKARNTKFYDVQITQEKKSRISKSRNDKIRLDDIITRDPESCLFVHRHL
jgi:hypothetical protein